MDPKITILVIEDNPGDAVLIREMLLGIPGSPFSVQWSDTLAKGLSRIRVAGNGDRQGKIDLALLDLNLPDSCGLETFLKLHETVPGLPVIVLSGREDDDLAIGAVRAGAEDYLIKGTVSGESLGRCIRYTLERYARQKRSEAAGAARAKRKGRVLGFIGAKGGVGTTTVALNVAASLAQQKHSVILAELRGTYGTLSHHFHRQVVPPNLSRFASMTPDKVTEAELGICISKHASGFRVVFGPQKVSEVKPLSPHIVCAVLSGLTAMADLVVLDLPPDPSDANCAALRECAFAGLVLEREPSCVAAGRIMLDHIRSWTHEVVVGAVVVNRIPLAIPMDLGHIATELGLGIAGLVPPAPDACVLAQRAGDPVVVTYADSLIADSFLKLASTVAEETIVIRKVA